MTELTLKTNTLFRIEGKNDKRSLWYLPSGEFDPFIKTLTDGKSADLPMEFSETYGHAGRRWYSACDNFEQMRTWFSDQDAWELYENSFVLRKYVVTEWRDLPMETVFTKEGVVSHEEIDISTIWSVNKYRN